MIPRHPCFLMFSDAVINRMIQWLRIPDSEAEVKAVLMWKHEAKIFFFDVPFEIRRYVFEIHDFNSLWKLPWNVSSACRQWMAWKRSCMSWGSSAVTWLSNVHRFLWLELSRRFALNIFDLGFLCFLLSVHCTLTLILSHMAITYDHAISCSSLWQTSGIWGFFTTNSIPTTTDMLKGDEQASKLPDFPDLTLKSFNLEGNSDRHLRLYCRHVQLVNVYPEHITSLVSPEQDDDVPWRKQKYKHVNMLKFKFIRYVGQDDCDGLQCCRCAYVGVC